MKIKITSNLETPELLTASAMGASAVANQTKISSDQADTADMLQFLATAQALIEAVIMAEIKAARQKKMKVLSLPVRKNDLENTVFELELANSDGPQIIASLDSNDGKISVMSKSDMASECAANAAAWEWRRHRPQAR